jgi:phosphoglycerate dehydrogenase-like enzyme
MTIIICGNNFPESLGVLRPLLPDDDVRIVSRAELPDVVRTADVLIPMMTRLDAGLIGATSARLIQQWGAGLEGVDIDAATARGIYVCNVPSDETANAESTAEHAVFLMLACARRLHTCARSFQDGVWGAPIGESLFGKRALIVGFGRIGRALARRLVALGMDVDAIRRAPSPDDLGGGVRVVGTPADLTRLAAAADFVVCAATATTESRGMIGAEVLAAMKPTAFVVTVSRGPLIDEGALIAALRERRIAGAGLDVFEAEPIDRTHPLLAMENVVATPHVGGVTRESYAGISRVVAANVRAVRIGDAPQYCANLDQVRA